MVWHQSPPPRCHFRPSRNTDDGLTPVINADCRHWWNGGLTDDIAPNDGGGIRQGTHNIRFRLLPWNNRLSHHSAMIAVYTFHRGIGTCRLYMLHRNILVHYVHSETRWRRGAKCNLYSETYTENSIHWNINWRVLGYFIKIICHCFRFLLIQQRRRRQQQQQLLLLLLLLLLELYVYVAEFL